MSELEPLKEVTDLDLAYPEKVMNAGAPNLAFRATLLDQRAFQVVNLDSDSFRRGSAALLFAVGMAALARLLGIALGVLTLPRIDIVQEQILRGITGTAYYAELVQQSPEFAAQFAAGYASVWEVISLVGGYPSYSGLISALISLLFLLGTWLAYGTAVHLVARWFGTQVEYKRTLGVMALAYTPILLTVVEAIPGASVPLALVFTLMLIGKFLAIKTLYQMGPGQNLAILALPYVIGLVLLIGLLLFAAALGLSQFPIIDDFLRTLRFARGVR